MVPSRAVSPTLPPPPIPPVNRAEHARRVAGCGCVWFVGLFFFVGMAFLLVANIPNPVALALAAAAAVLPVPTLIFLILQVDRYEREPWRALLVAFLWGALVATFISAIFNDVLGASVESMVGASLGDTLSAGAVAPVVEETAKGFVLLLLYWFMRDEFDNTLDGIVYGALVGVGFAMTENILYFGRQYAEHGIIGLGLLFYIRVILGGFGHALYTATTGAALGYARETSNRRLALSIVPVGYAGAILQHAAWNFVGATLIPSLLPEDLNPLVLLFVVWPLVSVLLTGPGLLTLSVVVWCAGRREARVIHEQLADEVPAGALTEAEYERLSSLRSRFRAEVQALREHGLRGYFAQRDLHQAASNLAFRKWHVARGEKSRTGHRLSPEELYRRQIAVLRTRLA
ncbi:MAG: PrsW family intramembrane metalloprotease [Chloroflexi bacterium]|nr:PrsW family intramembrane metalloprotease [Chloroflexota bacterium]